jgi:hypothetical protein
LQISREHGYIVCATAAGVFLHTINAKLLASTGVPTSTLLLVPSSEEQGGELLVTGAPRPRMLLRRNSPDCAQPAARSSFVAAAE